jgi:hypothetical protein
MFLEANGALRFVAVVEHDGNARFRNACLAALVDEILQRCKLFRSAWSFPSLHPPVSSAPAPRSSC